MPYSQLRYGRVHDYIQSFENGHMEATNPPIQNKYPQLLFSDDRKKNSSRCNIMHRELFI